MRKPSPSQATSDSDRRFPTRVVVSRESYSLLILFIMRLLFCLLALPLFSAPVGNPGGPVLLDEGFWIPDTFWSNVQAGATQDFLIQKKLMPAKKFSHLPLSKIRMEGNSQIADLVWCIREKLNIQMNLGSARFKWRWNDERELISGSGSGFFLGGDIKLVLLEAKDTVFAADGQAGIWKDSGAEYSYWQGAFALSHKFPFLAPYAGWTFNGTNFKAEQISFRALILSGPFAGCTISNGSRFFLSAEYRGWFEQGASVSAQVRF